MDDLTVSHGSARRDLQSLYSLHLGTAKFCKTYPRLISKADCTFPEDREFILRTVTEWYGSSGSFITFVQTTLREELAHPVSPCVTLCHPVSDFSNVSNAGEWLCNVKPVILEYHQLSKFPLERYHVKSCGMRFQMIPHAYLI